MSGPLRWALGLLILTSASLTGAVPAQADPPASAPVHAARAVSGTDDDSILRLGSCLAAGGQGDILLLFDTSASIQQTDGDNGRITAAKYLVGQLAAFVSSTPGTKIDVGVAGFADRFSMAGGWTSLTASSVGGVQSKIATFADQRSGFETDYWQALTGARQALARKAGASQSTCQAVVWLTDGQYALDSRKDSTEIKRYGDTKPYDASVTLDSKAHADEVQRAGTSDLCRAGGVADQMRGQGVVTVAIGLGQDVGSFALMRRLATDSGGAACGRSPQQSPGVFVPANGVGGLLLAFDALSDPSHPATTSTFTLCRTATTCRRGTQTFVLDSTISQVRLLAATSKPGYQVYLEGPSGQQIRLEKASAAPPSLPGTGVQATWLSDSAVQIQLRRTADEGWNGVWHVAFVDPASQGAAVTTNLRLYGDVKPVLVDAGSLRPVAGGSARLTFGLQHADGSAIVPTSVTSTVRLDARLVPANGTPVTIASGLGAAALGRATRLDLSSVSPGSASVELDLQLTTTPPAAGVRGTTLQPVRTSVPVTIVAPPNYPKVATNVVFATTDVAGAHHARVPVSGPGCVWLGGSDSLTRPNAVRSVRLGSSASSAGSCARGSLPLTLRTSSVGAGLASGTVTVETRPAGSGGRVVPVTVRYEMEMRNPRNDEVFWPLLVALTLVGLLLPVGLLYLVKWWTSRIPGTAVALVSVAGPVTEESSFLATASPSEQDARTEIIDGTDRRSLPLNATSTIRTHTGWGLTEPGFCAVDGQTSVGSTSPGTTKSHHARLPLAVRDRWIALLDTADPLNGPVELVFLLAPGSGRLPELVQDARNRVPELVSRLRRDSGVGSAGDNGAATPVAVGGGSGWGSTGGDTTASSGSGWGSPTAPPTTPASGTSGTGGTGGWGSPTAPATPPEDDGGWGQ